MRLYKLFVYNYIGSLYRAIYAPCIDLYRLIVQSYIAAQIWPYRVHMQSCVEFLYRGIQEPYIFLVQSYIGCLHRAISAPCIELYRVLVQSHIGSFYIAILAACIKLYRLLVQSYTVPCIRLYKLFVKGQMSSLYKAI